MQAAFQVSAHDLIAVRGGAFPTIEKAGVAAAAWRRARERSFYVKASVTLAQNVEHLVLLGGSRLSGTGNTLANAIEGNDAANRLFGLEARDVLSGMGGKDTLVGGEGADRLTGGASRDTFVYRDTSESDQRHGRDLITDFAKGDRLNLTEIDANTKLAGNQAFTFADAGPVSGDAGTLYFQRGLLWADVNGDGRSDFEVKIAGGFDLAAHDILL